MHKSSLVVCISVRIITVVGVMKELKITVQIVRELLLRESLLIICRILLIIHIISCPLFIAVIVICSHLLLLMTIREALPYFEVSFKEIISTLGVARSFRNIEILRCLFLNSWVAKLIRCERSVLSLFIFMMTTFTYPFLVYFLLLGNEWLEVFLRRFILEN